MIELDKKDLNEVNGGFWGMPTGCLVTVSCYAAVKFLLSNEPLTEEELMTSAFWGLILSASNVI